MSSSDEESEHEMEASESQHRLVVPSAARALKESAFQGTLEMDVGNMTAYDPSPIVDELFFKDPTAAMLRTGQQIAQTLVGEIFVLPVENSSVGLLARLPPPTTRIPREKPFPQAKPQTKWQKFAKEKGITKKKRSKAVWDDDAGEWKRRYGYKRTNDENDIAFVEAKPGDTPDTDPFAEAKKAKKERITKNSAQKLKNQQNSESGFKVPDAVKAPSSVALSSQLPFEGSRTGSQGKKVKQDKKELKNIQNVAALSTASVGKFDKKLSGEKAGRPEGKRRQFLPVTDQAQEKKLIQSTVTKVLKKEQESILNVEKAVKSYITEGHNANREKKRKTEGKGKSEIKRVSHKNRKG